MEVWTAVIELVTALAWPLVTVLLTLLLRPELRTVGRWINENFQSRSLSTLTAEISGIKTTLEFRESLESVGQEVDTSSQNFTETGSGSGNETSEAVRADFRYSEINPLDPVQTIQDEWAKVMATLRLAVAKSENGMGHASLSSMTHETLLATALDAGILEKSLYDDMYTLLSLHVRVVRDPEKYKKLSPSAAADYLHKSEKIRRALKNRRYASSDSE